MRPDAWMPVMLFTGFGAAFRSVIHQWLLIVMDQPWFPVGLRFLVEALYSAVVAISWPDIATQIPFILKGIIQGCALASFHFVISFDPFLRMLSDIIESKCHGIVQACADDVGAALVSLRHLKDLATVLLPNLLVSNKKSGSAALFH